MICKLIIIEDEPAILQGIAAIIERSNLDVQLVGTFTNAEAALEQLPGLQPHIVITDIQMPGLSGLELINLMKQRTYDAEYLILSGFADFEYVREALKLSVHNYLLKPPRVSELTTSLEYLCRKISDKLYTKTAASLERLLTAQTDAAQIPSELLRFPGYLLLYNLGDTIAWQDHQISESHPEINSGELHDFLQQNKFSMESVWIYDRFLSGLKIFVSLDGGTSDPEHLGKLLLRYSLSSGKTTTIITGPPIWQVSDLLPAFTLCRQKLQSSIMPGANRILRAEAEQNLPIEKIVNLLYAELQKDLSHEVDLEAFAHTHGYNQNYLVSQFSAQKGISPRKYLIRLRMEHAGHLLRTTKKSTKEIALSVGYSDLAYFSRAFKDYMGTSPKNYRSMEGS